MGAGLVALVFATQGLAQAPGPMPTPNHMPPQSAMTKLEMDHRAARRFPQPVCLRSLLGHRLLEPLEAHPVLGRVASFGRRGDGSIDVVILVDGQLGLGWLGLSWINWHGFGSRLVGVPAEAVAIFGNDLALMDLTPERLRALATFVPESIFAIGPDETVRMGIVEPFHG